MSESKDKLRQVSPGFFSDRDETWMSYLVSKAQLKLRKLRSQYHSFTEAFDQFQMSYQAEMIQMKKASEQEKASKTTQFNDKKKLYEAKYEELIGKALAKYSEAKEEASKIKEARLQEEAEKIREQTQYNKDNEHVVDIDDYDEGLDYMGVVTFSSASYLPSAVIDKKPTVSKTSFVRPKQRSVISTPSKSKSKSANIDPSLKDLPAEEVEIIKEIKPLVQKYNCRDRISKAIQSINRRENDFSAMDFFTATVAKMKADVEKYKE